MKISIKPKELVYVRHISSIEIQQGQLSLNNGISFQVLLYDESDVLISVESVSITGDDYASWGTDDNYINDLILSKLELELPQ